MGTSNLIRKFLLDAEDRQIEREAISAAEEAVDVVRLNELAKSSASKITWTERLRFKSAFDLMSSPLPVAREPLDFYYRTELWVYLDGLEKHSRKVAEASWSLEQAKELERIRVKQSEINLILKSANGEHTVILGSQANIEPDGTKAIQANDNDTEFSGLLNIPKKKDDWFRVIDDMTRSFCSQYREMPNQTQAWAQLWVGRPKGYEITTDKDRGEDCLKMPGVIKPLSKDAFLKRWEKYIPNKG